MKKAVFLALILGGGCTVPAPATYRQVIVDGQYDVTVGIQEIGGNTQYFVNGTSVWTQERPSWNDAQEVYVKAIEQVSGCKVNQEGIFWDSMITTGPTVMRAYPEC